MTQPSTAEQLLNLADRAERGTLTGDEAARLREGIAQLRDRPPLVCCDERHQTKVQSLEAEIERMKLLVAASSEPGQAVRMAAQHAERAIENGKRAEKAERAVDHLTDRYRGAEERAERAEAARDRYRAAARSCISSHCVEGDHVYELGETP
ncbi:hypothetical protein [Streptomyces vilmorinianum]|uniref:hypothetical protein n=1 Tax=Streptomyces vilmorinianum TaxID=3051092 RepID=UPI0010FB3278|nr:hypothetical protein [Streptomyces vilmorinianum]